MNCLEARRRLLAGPGLARRAAAAHLARCAPCARFARGLARLDARVAAALELRAPSGLADRCVERSFARQRRNRRIVVAATCLGLASTLAGAFFTEREDPAARASIDFVVGEEARAILVAHPADEAQFLVKMRASGIALPVPVDRLRYIGPCPYRGTVAYHAIAATPYGKVTMLLVPGLPVPGPGSAQARGLRARVAPALGGSIAVIGKSRRAVERVYAMVARS